NYTAVTIEAWATFPDTLPGACFFFAFGNQDGSGLGNNYIYMQPASGHIGIGGNDPGYVGEEDAGTYGNLSSHTNLHITAVFNPQANWIAVYTNGILAGKNTATTWQMNNVSSVLNYIGRSLYSGDSQSMDVNVDEYRIYSGALTPQGIAISDAAGPNSIPATVTNGPGALLSLSIQAPATLQPLQSGPVKLLANYANLSNWDIIGNSIFPPAGLTVSVSNTNVLAYANGSLTGVNAGTASVITVYQGLTNTASVTVVQAAAPILAHRYSFFNEPSGSLIATDSVAGFNGTLQGSANITGGQLVIPNTAQAAPAPDYLLLPNGILTNSVNGIGTNFNFPAVTVEAWATFASVQGYWAALFDFGYTDAGGAGAFDIHLGQLGGSTVYGISDSDNANNHNQSTTAGSVRGMTNAHIVVVFNPPAGYLACYTNGVLASQINGITISMAGVWGTLNKVGADLWPDPGMQGSISEFRIYNGVMSPNDVAAAQVLGSTQVLVSSVSLSAVKASGGNLLISWPVAGGSYALQYNTSLNSGTWTTISSPAAQIVGNQWQVTVPDNGGTKFYRLAR
ncbi:MAG TPA: LamG-like jellyroll fold domain-containing protein, partial [Candidatus Acidoferrum sp.]|nr:LamG-like jellyroll fold domain-containing protein [Candidatus Acidoferrum sp.]